MGGTLSIRLATTADTEALAQICVLTGNDGADATGMFVDDRVLADVFAIPYLHSPAAFAFVWDEGAGPVGYVLGTADTRSFQRWFVDQWWPGLAARGQRTARDAWLLSAAADPKRMLIDGVDEYPAHLHIDLMSGAQGRGIGRQLIEAACTHLAERSVPGVYATAAVGNAGALAFYPRVGFVRHQDHGDAVTFVRPLATVSHSST